MPLKNFKNVGELQMYEYLLGKITSVDKDTDTCGLTIGDSTFDAVPIFFHCDPDVEEQSNGSLKGAAVAFKEQDDVIVLTERAKEISKLFVIAHVLTKRSCEETKMVDVTIIVTDCRTGEFLQGVSASAVIQIGERTDMYSVTTDAQGIAILTVTLPKDQEVTINWAVELSADGYDSGNLSFTTTADYTTSACLNKPVADVDGDTGPGTEGDNTYDGYFLWFCVEDYETITKSGATTWPYSDPPADLTYTMTERRIIASIKRLSLDEYRILYINNESPPIEDILTFETWMSTEYCEQSVPVFYKDSVRWRFVPSSEYWISIWSDFVASVGYTGEYTITNSHNGYQFKRLINQLDFFITKRTLEEIDVSIEVVPLLFSLNELEKTYDLV